MFSWDELEVNFRMDYAGRKEGRVGSVSATFPVLSFSCPFRFSHVRGEVRQPRDARHGSARDAVTQVLRTCDAAAVWPDNDLPL